MSFDIETTELAELCEQVIDCPHSTPVWMDTGVIVLRSSNIRNGRLDLSNPSYTDEYHYQERSRRAKVQAGDLVITREAPMGEVCLIPGDLKCCLGQRMVMLRPDRERCDGKYLLYALQSNRVQNEIRSHEGTGSTVSNLRIPVLKSLPIPTPGLANQKVIAHILGTLDDKIELNRKTNETLEAIAKALFKSWFVDFDPVRAKAEGRPTGLPAEISDLFPDSFEDSELGEIPSGWNVAELGDISTISGGKQLESVELKSNGRFPVYGANGTMGFHDLATHNSFVIVFGRVGAYCGSINWEYGGAWVNNNASSVIPLRYNELVLQWMLEADYSNYRTGSAQPFIPNGALACSPVLMPTDALASVFCDLLLPIRLKQKKNQSAALSLVEIRDALLPKLISGEIRIPDAERMLEEVGV